MQVPQPKQQYERRVSSDSKSDDCIVAASELQKAREEARAWRTRYDEMRAENSRLVKGVESMEECIDNKLS